MSKKTPNKELSYKAVFICGLCGEKIGGGRVGLVTHAVFFHNWNIKEVQERAKCIGLYDDKKLKND